MAIDYVEIRDEYTNLLGIVDTAQSVIWRSVYFGVGDFELYVQATPDIIELLQAGRLVTRPDDLEVGIIEKINIENNQQDGMMLTVSGRFAKSILERRLIYNLSGNANTPTILRGNVETEVRRVIEENAINCPFDSRRNIPQLALGALNYLPQVIVDENGEDAQKQVSFQNLLTYTDELLQEYGLGSTVILDKDAGLLRYVIYEGVDRRWGNVTGFEPILFSKDFDNLTSSSYAYDETPEKNFALIGGAGEDAERFYSVVAGWQEGLQRRELWVDASSLNRTYKDDSDVEHTYSDSEYSAMLQADGAQKLAAQKTAEHFDGSIDIQNSRWQYNQDFTLGDIVTMQDDEIGKYIDVRLLEILEVQDENGYSIEATTQT
jgi:hypothetical protein